MLSNLPFMTGPEPSPAQQTLKPAHQELGLPSDVVAVYPLTRSQEGLWHAYSFAPHRTLYNLTLKFTFSQKNTRGFEFSIEALHKAINALTLRHSILRSTFHGASKIYSRPFIAEWDPKSARPILQVITKPNTAQTEAKLLSLLRSAVDISSTFPVRWIVILGPAETELFLVSHHIALDGGSMSQLSKELFTLLGIKSDSNTGSVAEEIFPEPFYRAHIREAAFQNSSDFDLAKDFWLRQSNNVRPIKWKSNPSVEISSRRQNYREIQTWCTFSNDELRTWGNRYRTSWFRVAVSLVGVLVLSMAEPDGGADHAITVAFGGRPAGMENCVGQFANAVPMRIPLADVLGSQQRPTFEALVKLVSKEVSTAKKHERFSYLDLANVHRKLGLQVPTSQVAITLSPKLSRPECSLYPVEGPYDLFFCFLEGEDGVTLGVIYDPGLFSESDITVLKETFMSLQALSIASGPLYFSTLSAVTPHVPRLLPELDLNSVDAISAARFHVWFENQALQNPDLLALHSGEQECSITYHKLNQETNRKAHYLRRLGISRGSVVLLHLSRNFCMMEWIISVLKSGAAFAVADQKHPDYRTRSVITIARPALILDDGNGVDLMKDASELHSSVLDVRRLSFEDMPTDNLEDVTQNNDLAYIVFTSGSTGQPKGVEIEHRNLSHFVVDSHISQYVSLSPGSRVLQFATFAFDAAVLEWSQCLALGGTLCFADMPQALIGDYLADVIDTNEISFMHVTPSVLATLPTSRALPSLRQISVGGEMVPENLIKSWRTRVQVQNAYGPTECTVVMSHHAQPRAPEEKQPLASIIGAPHRHSKFVVSNDSFTRILPINEIGEVCIGGPQVGRGYRGREDLTASRFATHPEFGERLYRTGDRGKLLADGSVLLIGRIDREVKVRGYRIELDDIERTISDLMPEITGVSVQPDESGSTLCAFLAPENIDGDLLKSVLSKRLPSYMVPASVYCFPRLPLNTNDKVDHKTIRATMGELIAEARQSTPERVPFFYATPPDTDSSDSDSSTLSSPSALQAISQIWQKILNLPQQPSPTVNFFDLGGNSMLIQTLADQLKIAFPLTNVRVVDLFSRATILAQADLVDERRASLSKKPSFSQLPVTSVLPIFPFSSDEGYETGILDIWKTVLGVQDLSPTTNFFDAGGHSIAVTQVLDAIRVKWPSVNIKIVDLFHHSTVKSQAALVAKYLPKINPSSTPPKVVPTAYVPKVQQGTTPALTSSSEVAIIGIAGRFPGASNPDELFQLFVDKKEGLSTFSEPDPGSMFFKGAIYVPKRGAISNVEDFDPSRWGLKEDEARDMDPQQRLFLDVTREALEDSGHYPSSDSYNNVALSVGAAHNTWSLAANPSHGDDFHKAHDAILTPCISARTAYHLNLHGPNVTLNTACSSGLVAMSIAVDNLRSGKCDMSIAGGVSIAFPQEGYVTAERQLFSPSGHCRPLDHRADGTLPGDAVCALVLRRLDDAIRDNDKIYSVISGIAVGSDGGTDKAGCTVPSPQGQANIIVRAWNDSGLPASKLVYAELHGSGTPIGDALELEAMNMARSKLNAEKIPITVGSNKGNLGNCEAAGGIVSVIKMCKSMQHNVVPAMPSFERPNPMINPDLPFTIAASETQLSREAVLSVSSIGLGGVNAHCVLRFPPASSQRAANTMRLSTVDNSSASLLGTDAPSAIAQCASRILGVEIQKDADLRASGLDSLGQFSLMHQVNKALPSSVLPISAFYQQECTPASLARSLKPRPAQHEEPLPPYITVLRFGDPASVCALIAPGGGSCASYLELSRHLSTSATIVALEHPIFASPPATESHAKYSVGDLGDKYAVDLKKFFKEMKECVLIGASFGGVVAIELHHRLSEAGSLVKSLTFLDSPWPKSGNMTSALHPSSFISNLFGESTRDKLLNHPSAQSIDLQSSPSDISSQCASIHSVITKLLSLATPADREVIERHNWKSLVPAYVHNVHALYDFSISDDYIRHVKIPALYFRATLSDVSSGLDNWMSLFPELSVHNIKADHASLYSGSNAQKVAALISKNTT